MRTLVISLCILLLAGMVVAAQPFKSTMASDAKATCEAQMKKAKAAFDIQVQKAQAVYDAEVKKAQKGYAETLDMALVAATKDGDLDEALKLKAEKEGADSGQPPIATKLSGLWEVRTSQGRYRWYYFASDGFIKGIEGSPLYPRIPIAGKTGLYWCGGRPNTQVEGFKLVQGKLEMLAFMDLDAAIAGKPKGTGTGVEAEQIGKTPD